MGKLRDAFMSTRVGWLLLILNASGFFWNLYMTFVHGPVFLILCAMSAWVSILVWQGLQQAYALKTTMRK